MSPRPYLLALMLLAADGAAATVEPPARYVRPNPDVRVVEVPYFAVDPTCRARFPTVNFPPPTATHRVLGCATVGSPCLVILPLRDEGVIGEERWQEILRHELAHCNGWPSTHPQE